MSEAGHSRRHWLVAAGLCGLAYFLIGMFFTYPVNQTRALHLASWLASGIVFARHLGYERRHGTSARAAAGHVAAAVAFGTIALVVAAMIKTAMRPATIGSDWLVAIILWPLVLATAAFVIAWAAALVLARIG
jgi:hypothetical protein